MSRFRFFPEDWEPDEKIIAWCRGKGISDKQIAEQLEEIKDYEFQKMRSCPNRTFRTWMRNAIKWGNVTPAVQPNYRKPQEVSKEEAAENVIKFEEQIRKLTGGR